jgi:hypothetical protein
MDDERDHREKNQKVYEAARHVKREEPEQPQHQQHYRKSEEHMIGSLERGIAALNVIPCNATGSAPLSTCCRWY